MRVSLHNRHRSAEGVSVMRKNREIKAIFAVMAVFFAGFLAVPMISVLVKSFTGNGEAASLSHYVEVLTRKRLPARFGEQLCNLHMQCASRDCPGLYPGIYDPLYKCGKKV